MAFLRDYPLSVPAGSAQNINIDADGFVCVETNLTQFQVQINDQSAVTFEQQFEYNAPPGEGIKKLRIINIDQTNALVVTLKIWRGAFRDRRTVFTQVKGLEPVTLEETVDRSYSAFLFAQPGTDTTRPALFNPAGSGKLVALTGFHYSIIPRPDVPDPYPHVIVEDTPTVQSGALLANSYANRLGLGVGVSEVVQFPLGYVRDHVISVPARASVDDAYWQFPRPIILPAGRGVVFRGSDDVLELRMTLDLLEVDG